jgi:hypothetical protein
MAQGVSKSKMRRHSADKGYYANFKATYPVKLLRRKANREKRLIAVSIHPEIGSPSQLRTRVKLGKLTQEDRRKAMKKKTEAVIA